VDREKAVRFMHDLLRIMVERNGSDLLINVGMPPAAKIDGLVVPIVKQVLQPRHTQVLVHSLMNDRQSVDFEREQECNFAIGIPGLARFRVSAFVQRGEAGMVLRRIQNHIPTLDELNMPVRSLEPIAMAKRGLVIVVGSTSSGKSTTLAAMLGHRNRSSAGHIITIEDPIEFIHPHEQSMVTQREVGMDTESYQTALKNTLRQAPDVILIGEIRDRETMDYAIAFAETGHLCLSTLHANSTNQAMDRIINFFPEDRRQQLLLDLSLNLRAVISQRLVRKDGQSGRIPATEILTNTPLMTDLILKGAVHDMKELMGRSREQGMQTFDQALFDLYESGQISYKDAIHNADSMNDLSLRIKLESQRAQREEPELVGGEANFNVTEDESEKVTVFGHAS